MLRCINAPKYKWWCTHNSGEWTILAQTIFTRRKIVIDSHAAWFDRQLQRMQIRCRRQWSQLLSAFGSQISWGRLKAMLLFANRLNPQNEDVEQQTHAHLLYHTPLKYIMLTMWIKVRRWFGNIGVLWSSHRS